MSRECQANSSNGSGRFTLEITQGGKTFETTDPAVIRARNYVLTARMRESDKEVPVGFAAAAVDALREKLHEEQVRLKTKPN